MKYVSYYEFPIGKIGIAEDMGGICMVFFCNVKTPNGFELNETPLIENAAAQFTEYFNGKRKVFDLPLNPKGTPFQLAVWNALQTIPYGETRSYKQIAEIVGNPKASRAIGMANNRNPIALIVPCHRVIGHSGKLVGYAGGLSVKEYLLQLEKSNMGY